MVRTAVDTMSNRRFIIVDLVFTAEGVDRTERDARTVLFPITTNCECNKESKLRNCWDEETGKQ